MAKLTSRDVIQRSLLNDSASLAATLQATGEAFMSVAIGEDGRQAGKKALLRTDRCLHAANVIREGDADKALNHIMNDPLALEAALLCACKLQSLPAGADLEIAANSRPWWQRLAG
jgi:hypothetical protein